LAKAIEEKRMKDFGSFFKGFDFENDNRIDKKQAVQILHTLMSDVLTEAEIFAIVREMADP
jgi:Ca2+-binding EF-hand superfamily protein